MSTPQKAPRAVNYEDVDDLIGIAGEMQDLERERVSVEDLTAVAKDLDIPERYVTPAIAELERRRKAALEAEARKLKRRMWALIGGAALALIVVCWMLVGQARLGTLAADAAQKRAQVVNVIERQAATERQWRDLPHSEQKSAELSGAENRVRIERRRYDEAAAAYNAAVSGFPGGLWASIFGHPDAMPLSNELERF